MSWRGPWVRRACALGCGAIAALAHPPFGVLPGLIGYGLLMRMLDGVATSPRPLRSAFLTGWLAGLSYFAIGVWWVAEAFLVDAEHTGWMAPFAVALLAAGMGLFWGAAALIYRVIAPSGVRRALVFAGVFAALEWLRGHVLTGFPWNLPGESFRAGSALSQGASLVGAYGLTWIVLAVSAGVALAREGRKGGIAAATAVAVLAGLWGYGAVRLHNAPPTRADAPIVRVVQADVPQSAKYDAAVFQDIFDRYIRLTPSSRATIVVWPEGAIPAAFEDYLAPKAWTRAAIARTLTPNQTLLVGGFRQEGPRFYNTMLALRGPQLAVQGRYDKYRLVPFGEYLPLEPLWFGVKQMVGVGDGFSSGPLPAPISIGPGLPMIQPLICYESLFPGFTRAGRARTGFKSGLIVNISNDAWFGRTSGPLQHLNLASYRAIEEGLPLVRATPTGVSAVIDAFGRKGSQSLGLGREGALEAPLPPSLASTVYSLCGDTPFAVFLLLSLVVAWRLDGRPRLEQTR